MAKLKTKLTINAFWATQSLLPPIHALRIAEIDEGFPTQKQDDIPEEPLIPPPSEIFVTESGREIISSFY